MADSARARKIADRIRQTVAMMLEKRIKDPRIGFVTVTDVRVTGDLQHASIFYTVYGGERAASDTAAALESAKGMIRSEVGKNLGIRLTPSLEFIPDALPKAAADIERKLSDALGQDEELARRAQNAAYAGEADPYRKPREESGEIDGFEGFEEDEL